MGRVSLTYLLTDGQGGGTSQFGGEKTGTPSLFISLNKKRKREGVGPDEK